MTKVVITGAGGQLGVELCRARWPRSFAVEALTSADLDITDAASTAAAMTALRPDIIVNAAAYTAVDRAEDEADRAFAVNATGVSHLATVADRLDALFVHFSTDYVFDGTSSSWYVERDQVSPLGVYGRSKAAGELAARSAARAVVLRVSWIYGSTGSNFVSTMLRLARERDEIGVVGDQVGCPTAAADVALAVTELVSAEADGAAISRLYHLAAPDDASWFELASSVFEASASGFDGRLRKLTTAEYPTAARRPANSRLDASLIAADLGIHLPSWRSSLPAVVSELEAVGV